MVESVDFSTAITMKGVFSEACSLISQIYQVILYELMPLTMCRWAVSLLLLWLFVQRIIDTQGFYVVAHVLGIHHLALLNAFLTPNTIPSLARIDDYDVFYDEGDDDPALPIWTTEERLSVPTLTEFKFWLPFTKGTLVAFFCTFIEILNVPVFWPPLAIYSFVLLIEILYNYNKETN